MEISELPLQLPEVDKYLPTETGEPPLGRAKNWTSAEGYPIELCTMPGFAGSSAYYLRYMDPHNSEALVSKEADEYWRNVDLYIGGTEHATGHLIYSRFWNKFLYDLGVVCEPEPFKKLINQGMIQGRSNFVYRIKDTNTFVSYNLRKDYDVTPIHVDVNIVNNDILDTEAFKAWRPDYADAEFILEDGKYVCGYAVEKMSKSMFNVVNPDDIVERYGADTLRLYEMFLGPLEQSKPPSVFVKKKIKMRAGETDKSVSYRDEKLFVMIKNFVEECGFRGMIDIDIFEKNGIYYISEVNPRFGGGYPHAYACGVNMPKQVLENLARSVGLSRLFAGC